VNCGGWQLFPLLLSQLPNAALRLPDAVDPTLACHPLTDSAVFVCWPPPAVNGVPRICYRSFINRTSAWLLTLAVSLPELLQSILEQAKHPKSGNYLFAKLVSAQREL